ncbi:MAG: ribbon-helix-helix protein, CopG family [Aeriscardovia sp.]|nr:ribbon-helix-helix protein, CopG family [Aeriscardovia sp.]MBR6354253.1 ribbon-helix-helix protein, CopG family [Paludibacteraceae bacterium]
MGINGGRSLRGIEETGGYQKYNITLPPSIIERLDKFMKEEERNRSWTIQKALDEYLKKRGY